MEPDRSPAQQPRPEYRAGQGEEHDGAAIPEYDKRDGAAGMVKRKDSRAQRPGNQSRDSAGAHEVGRRSLAQGPNERGEWRDGEEGNANQAGRPLRSKEHSAPSRRMGINERDDAC